MDIVDMAPPDGAAAMAQDAVDMACGWGGSLRRMKEHGNVLLTGPEKEELGILVFDVTSAPASWVAENSDIVAQFLKVTAEANAMWNSGEHTEEMLPVIAQDAGMDPEATRETLATFVFPDVDAQLSERWLGAAAPAFLKGVADVFVEAGSIDAALDSYGNAINIGPLQEARSMMGM
jgi:taurine transport system substrate-binding protein